MNYATVAVLKTDTPFNRIFPDRKVPIISIVSMIPREEGCPECFMIDSKKINSDQINSLANLLLSTWPHEISSIDEAIEYVKKGLPLKTDWFDSCQTSNPGIFFSMMPDFDSCDFRDEIYDSELEQLNSENLEIEEY